MICKNCNHTLPNDSEFCQYCGNKIEKVVTISETTETDLLDLENATPEEALDAIVKIQAEETVKNMKANGKNQHVNEEPLCPSTNARNITKKNKFVSFTNISNIVLACVAIIVILIAMVVQDPLRSIEENCDPTIIYFSLLVVLSLFLVLSIVSLVKNRFKLVS